MTMSIKQILRHHATQIRITAHQGVPDKQSFYSVSSSEPSLQLIKSCCQTPITGGSRSPTESLKLWMKILKNSGRPWYKLPQPSSSGTCPPRMINKREKKQMNIMNKVRKGMSMKMLWIIISTKKLNKLKILMYCKSFIIERIKHMMVTTSQLTLLLILFGTSPLAYSTQQQSATCKKKKMGIIVSAMFQPFR